MFDDRLIHNGEDITTDVVFKIEHVVRIIAEREHVPFDDAYALFVASKTYTSLQNPLSLMWAESAEFIADRCFGG